MFFPRSLILAVLSAPFLAFAAENPFNNPVSGTYSATAGKSLQLSWKPTTAGTVSLYLRYGNPGDLVTVQTIATGIDNSGSYTYNIPDNTPQGGAYAVEIVSDSDTSQTNYTPQFTLTSTNTASPTGVGSSSSASMSTAASTESPSSSATRTVSSSSSSASMSSDSSSSMTMTGSSSMMTSTTTGSSSASASSAASSSQAGLVASQSSSTSSGGVARATAMAGMLGVVALGALAL